jgi:hypothetical protein
MVCVGVAGMIIGGDGNDPAGVYLHSYDPEFDDGYGAIHWTGDKSEAMKFPSLIEGWGLWQTVPVSRPVRADGQPNRPLTCFTVTFEEGP